MVLKLRPPPFTIYYSPAMLPEISRRCLACGASFREGALFCPECGKPLTKPADGTSDPKAGDDMPTSPLTSAPSEPANNIIASPRQSPVAPALEMQSAAAVPKAQQAPEDPAQKET